VLKVSQPRKRRGGGADTKPSFPSFSVVDAGGGGAHKAGIEERKCLIIFSLWSFLGG